MKTLSILFTSLLAFSSLASKLECSLENSPHYIEINKDRTSGYLDADGACIILECVPGAQWLECEGFFQNIGYYVSLDYLKMDALIMRTDGMSYNTLSILNCKESNEVTPES